MRATDMFLIKATHSLTYLLTIVGAVDAVPRVKL